MGADCTAEQAACESQSGTSGAGSSACPKCPCCGQTVCPDPVACGMKMWHTTFFQAMQAVQIDILKPKIQKAWGPMMEKAADAALEAIGTMWSSGLGMAKAKADFRKKLEQLWLEKK